MLSRPEALPRFGGHTSQVGSQIEAHTSEAGSQAEPHGSQATSQSESHKDKISASKLGTEELKIPFAGFIRDRMSSEHDEAHRNSSIRKALEAAERQKLGAALLAAVLDHPQSSCSLL